MWGKGLNIGRGKVLREGLFIRGEWDIWRGEADASDAWSQDLAEEPMNTPRDREELHGECPPHFYRRSSNANRSRSARPSSRP